MIMLFVSLGLCLEEFPIMGPKNLGAEVFFVRGRVAARGSVGFFTMTWDMGESPSKIDWEIFKTVVWKWSFGSHKAAIIGRFTQ